MLELVAFIMHEYDYNGPNSYSSLSSHHRHFDGPPRPGYDRPEAMTTNRCVPTNRTARVFPPFE